jgi:hypothetical protein
MSKRNSKVRILLRKDILGKYGYKDVKKTSKQKRHIALHKAINEEKPLSVYRRLVALSTLNKYKDPTLHDKFRDDAEWIKTQKEYKRGSKK